MKIGCSAWAALQRARPGIRRVTERMLWVGPRRASWRIAGGPERIGCSAIPSGLGWRPAKLFETQHHTRTACRIQPHVREQSGQDQYWVRLGPNTTKKRRPSIGSSVGDDGPSPRASRSSSPLVLSPGAPTGTPGRMSIPRAPPSQRCSAPRRFAGSTSQGTRSPPTTDVVRLRRSTCSRRS